MAGMIRTGAGRHPIAQPFQLLVRDLVWDFESLDLPHAELHLYGSVATGQAIAGRSDVDVLAIETPSTWALETSARLRSSYPGLCRAVAIGTAGDKDFQGASEAAYGNRVFLRHYCTQLAGPVRLKPTQDFPGDAAAARGFNGDLRRVLARWREDPPAASRIGRKTLFGAAGIVSVAEGMWTTDPATAVEIWRRRSPGDAEDMEMLLAWSAGTEIPEPDDVAAALREDGIVSRVVQRFGDEIGFWQD